MKSLVIEDLHVEIDGREILKGITLTVNQGEIHAIMGPNGNGKSTLLSAIMGHPRYKVTKGSIKFDNKDLLEMSIDERSRQGIFLAMQYPQEIPGVTNSDFLRAAMNARSKRPVSLFKFIKELETNIDILEMKHDLAHRFLNEGFSGGEKKRNEILQMKLLKPYIAMLDETDSGLDVDAIKVVAKAIMDEHEKNNLGLMIVSHYERFYELIKPTFAHVIVDGKIVLSGDYSLVKKIDEEGYDWLYKEYNVQPNTQLEDESISLGIRV
ncbi:MAG TPA: Fe-S cluster assembly ATPase SufC [Erysipelotrichaceae bacterium]|nr:Fe-S cluster assembly ATPase SufC [Erysipelotrichaceae bacterium]HCY06529.1 Fe-S cluster assembly ATPase SufC [Erysipelotrichaceae bacterium]